MLSEQEAREIAMDFHEGQGSALYAFGSSGHVDRSRLVAAIQSDILEFSASTYREEQEEVPRLIALLAYVEAFPVEEPPK